MIAVHACWRERRLYLWGETPSLRPAPAARGRRPAAPAPRPHPFAADFPALRDALALLGSAGSRGDDAGLTLRLPSGRRAPLPSPHLPHPDAAEAGGEAGPPAPWTVRSAVLTARAAFDFLLDLPAEPPQGVVVADTLRALAEVAKLALELVARGRVVPALEQRGGEWVARWLPVLTDEDDAGRLSAIRGALPAACGAADADAGDPVEDDVAALALAWLVDGCVRQSLAAERPLPPRRGRRTGGEAWLAALLAGDPAPLGASAATAALHGALSAWAGAQGPAVDSGIRTCFRLSAPEEGDAAAGGAGSRAAAAAGEGPWRLDFLLQAADDPSLIVSAEEVWRTRGALKVLRRTLPEPQERLLADLGRALRLFPPLEPALRGARPSGCPLDAGAAYHFLREGAPLLAQAGFAVRVPAWWKQPTARLGLTLRARPTAQTTSEAEGRFGLDALCAYDWQLSLGGEPLSADEFRALAKLKVPLVRFRGEWVELKPDEVQAALRLFEQGGAGEMTAAELLRLAAGAADAPAGLPLAGVAAEGWLQELLAADGDLRAAPAAAPEGFSGTLRPYQERGLGWLAFLDRLGLGACLADDMGLGKTVQLLALLVAERPAVSRPGKRRPPPTLLVCPMSLVGNWQREAAKFAPGLAVHVHHGGERLSGAALRRAVRGSDLVLTTYALAARDRDELAAVAWGRVVLDEAQNVKNAAARQAQAVRAFRASRRVALTGTPVENRLAELWSILEFLNPGLLGTASEFRRRFAVPVERYRDAERAAELQRLIRPFVLRRLKTDRSIIQDLPAKQEMKVFCNLTREQASLYQATVDEMLERIEKSEGIERRGLVLSTLLKLKQVCNHPAQLVRDGSALAGRSGKLARLEEVVEEVLEVGDRALVFTQFAEMGMLLQRRLEERFSREVPFLHGGTQRAAREALVARFQGDGGPPVLLLSLKAGGTGLNLTAANHVIHFDRWWNPAVEDQATDRAFRIGQRRDVQVRKLVCAGTLEERIDQVIEEKKALAGSVLGTGEAWLTELSTAELRRVVALGDDAVAE